jgi:hypothetical protein
MAFSSALSKVLEHIIALHIYAVAGGDRVKFDFKSGHSASLCTSVLNVLLSIILTEEVTLLFVSLTSGKHLTRLITGSFLNFWTTTLTLALLVHLHSDFLKQ